MTQLWREQDADVSKGPLGVMGNGSKLPQAREAGEQVR